MRPIKLFLILFMSQGKRIFGHYKQLIYNDQLLHTSPYDDYDGTGRQLFSDSKSPLFGTLDSYKGALKTLAKKVPLKN